MIQKTLLLLLLITATTQSQNFNKVDFLVLEYPAFSKVEDLASRIKEDFSTDEEKVRAAFFWLTTNIRYNLKEYYNPTDRTFHFRYANETERLQKIQAAKDKIVHTAFRTKRGVCEEYAQSFKKICDLLNIEAAVVTGSVRNSAAEIGKPKRSSNHAWNAVKLHKKWLLLDATWAAGFQRNGKWTQRFNPYFYDIPKEKIFKTHFPDDSIWILRFGRITIEEFYNQPIYGQQFLASNAALISPKNGIISIEKGGNIELIFNNLDKKHQVIYNFKGNKYAKKPIFKTEGKTTILTIIKPPKNDELYVYFNGQTALKFKIK
ncbi:transglutaminase domain-containing protein [Polaribacter sp. IC073]|uniref:transglutaminase domain-containing protein n=1 Tax=Polaribacter sp. IC073 TaxID=2508540 RepID=UPI001CB96F0B|nr:transglutaminase domain-containing protein [Polaribacter sp. IC073]